MKGPQVAGWTHDIGTWLNTLDPILDNIPDVWDQFLHEFSQQYQDSQRENRARGEIERCACRELTTLWVARLDDGTELKVTDPKEQQRDVEEEEAEDKEGRERVGCRGRRAGCCWRQGSFERLQCGG